MTILKVDSSKEKPYSVIKYITDPEKAPFVEVDYLFINKNLGGQMVKTAKFWNKAQDYKSRKYYHFKVSFAPQDWTKNGGTLTPEKATELVRGLFEKYFPDYEKVLAPHIDKDHLHVHVIINSVNLRTGKMIDMRKNEYAKMKDDLQKLCRENGLYELDWREATKAKRKKEIQPKEAVTETISEREIKAKGGKTWKDELRIIVDEALKNSESIDDFEKFLNKNGVTLSRFSETNISYKLGDHKAVRGDTLGGGYTSAAVHDAIKTINIKKTGE